MRKNPKSAIQIILSCLIILMGGALIVKAATTIGTNIDTGGSLTVSGNIGIGTSTPAWNLQVSGTYPSLALSDYSSAANSKHWLFSSMGGNLYIGTSTDAYATSTPPALAILNNGNVGVGTNTPNNLFQVQNLLSFDNVNFKTLVGYQAGQYDLGQENTYIGYQTGYSSSTASTNAADFNTAVGYMALYSNTTGSRNIVFGRNALYSNTTGYRNSAYGFDPLYSNITGYQNTSLGYRTSYFNTTGANNTAVGHASFYTSTTGSNNTAVGFSALYYNMSATSTTAIGYQSGYGVSGQTYSQNNVFIGYNSGFGNTIGNNNTLLGYQSGYNLTSGSSNIVIGYNVNAPSATSDQQLNIGNLIYGTGVYNGSSVSSSPVSGGLVGIGTTTPNNLLTIYSTTKAGLEFSGASGSNYKWTMGLDMNDAGKFKIASSTALGTSDRLVIDGAGNLSVGGYATTTAAGVFSPGRYPTGSTPTCTTNEEGGFLWNSTTKKTCVCTGSSWIEATSTTPTVCF